MHNLRHQITEITFTLIPDNKNDQENFNMDCPTLPENKDVKRH